jgi:hypothetical protein
MNAASLARRLLIQIHRWLGLLVGLVAVMWFASGIAMIYVGDMPRLSPQARLDHLPALNLALVRLAPAEAAARLVQGESAGAGAGIPQLSTVLGRPAYRFAGDRIVFADDGSLLSPLNDAASESAARQFMGVQGPALRLVDRLQTADQWTLSLRRGPLLKYEAGDREGTQLYVSPRAAEVVQVTTRSARAKAWIATIPHWLYFSGLRQNQPLWFRIVVWVSAAVCLLAVLGLMLAFTQWRRTRPLDLKRSIPYRGGMRWHYIGGAVFGVFALTWAFSGLLSMEPFAWTNVPDLQVKPEVFTGGDPDLAVYAGIDTSQLATMVAPRVLKEVGYRRIHGQHYFQLRTSGGSTQDDPWLVDAATLARRDQPFDVEDIMTRLRDALPGVSAVSQDLLQDYDDYYYSRGGAPLPVLRVKLDDPLQTWLYVDLRTSQVVANLHRYSRIERWLYNGLHSLDFRFWYSKRPLWDLAMITLLLGGLAASSLGLYYGVTRLVR